MYSLGIVTEAFLGIILTLDSWIYSLISSAYKIFMAIASARILSSDAYTAIANKVYVIVGVGMLFVLSYAIMKAIIDPDQMSKGDMAGGKILKSIAVAVIGLIVTPLLFDLAYMAQGKMLEDDILGKLFFRTGESTETIGGYTFNYDEELNGTGGAVAAVSVWQAFFYPADGVDPEEIIADPEIVRMNANIAAVGCAGTLAIGIAGAIGGFFTGGAGWVVAGAAVATCVGAIVADSNADKVEEAIDEEVTLAEAFSMVASGESFAIFQAFIEDIDEGNIKYTWFISTVCGAFVAYAFVSYAIDMGLRAAKLAYYQIIAPVPLILGVLPKNGDRVGKFAKAVMSTFLEVFVRISVVYIVIYIIAHLSELFSTVGALWDNDNLTNVESLIAMALLIIGLVLFAKQAPKIISDTFGLNAGNGLEGLNIMKKLRDGEVFTAGTMVGSTIKSGAQGAFAGWNRKNPDGTSRKFHQKLLGATGSMIGGAGSAAVRSGVGRARSGKPVGSVREMKDHIETTRRAVADKRKDRQDFFDQHPNVFGEGGQIEAKWSDVKDSTYRWFAGDRDMSKYKSDIAFAGNVNALLDDVRAEAEKKDATTKMWAKREKDLQEQELTRWRKGYNETTYFEELKKEREADTAYMAAASAVDEVTTRKTAMEQARKAHADAIATGASAAEVSRLEREFRARENEYMMLQPYEAERMAALEKEDERIRNKVDARAKLSDEEFTALSMEHQAKIKAARDKKELAADAYVAAQMQDENSVVYSKVQALLNDNQEYIAANASRELVIGVDAQGREIKVKVGDLVTTAFGQSALNGHIDANTVLTGNRFDLTMPGSTSPTTYEMNINVDQNGNRTVTYVNTANANDVLTEDQFAAALANASKVDSKTRINVAAKQGKDAKRSIPNSKSYRDDLKAARKDKEKK